MRLPPNDWNSFLRTVLIAPRKKNRRGKKAGRTACLQQLEPRNLLMATERSQRCD